jgi:hypothetical protein
MKYAILKNLVLIVFVLISLSQAQTDNGNKFNLVWQNDDDEGGWGHIYQAGWMLDGSHDFDEDGWGEFFVFDQGGGSPSTSLNPFELVQFEARGDNQYGLNFIDFYVGVRDHRGFMTTDLDFDGNNEAIIFLATDKPDPVWGSGQNAMRVYEFDSALGGLNPEAVVEWDPPRDLANEILLQEKCRAINLDSDENPEMVLTYQGGNGMYMTIFELETSSFENPQWKVEFKDTTRGNDRFRGLGFSDLDKDGYKEIISIPKEGPNIIIYECTGEDTYEVRFEAAAEDIPETLSASDAFIVINDMNADGIEEIYIADDDGQIWVVESTGMLPPEGKPFSPENFYKLGYIAPKKTIRGGLLGDQDCDGKLDIYYCGHERNNIFEIEYQGGSVTDSTSYLWYTLFEDPDPTDLHNLQIGYIQLGDDMDQDGKKEIIFVVDSDGDQPNLYVLESEDVSSGVDNLQTNSSLTEAYGYVFNYPNPFNSSTTINFALPKPEQVKITVYDILGQEQEVITNYNFAAGNHKIHYNANELTSGVYLYKLEAGNFISLNKFILLK